MRRCVIIGNAPISDPNRIKKLIKSDDYVICCDGGLRHSNALGVTPDLLVGDFDSYTKPETDIETIVLPREKDDTDSFFAAKEGARRGFKDFLLLGIFGGRLDHSMVNVSVMLWLFEKGCHVIATDDYSKMQIVGEKPVSIDSSYPYFSLLALEGVAKGVNITGAKFPLTEGTVTAAYQFATSNEVIPGETAMVSSKEGHLLLIKVLKDI